MDRISELFSLMTDPETPEPKFFEEAGGSRGRPKKMVKLGEKSFPLAMYNQAKRELELIPIGKRAEAARNMTPEEFVSFARSATPALVARAVDLALQSEDIRAILMVAKELSDRGYGKAVQGVQIHTGDDIHSAWKQLGVIDAEEIGEDPGKNREEIGEEEDAPQD